jgi:hypothetical protein
LDDREIFAKPALTFDEQLDRLAERGMHIPNRERAHHALTHLNYYRLCAYWLPFEADHATHVFRAEADFQRVLELYEFDRALRLLLMDAIERIEISVRTRLAYHLGHAAGSHAHENPACFGNATWHARNLEKLREERDRSDEEFVTHYRVTYHTPDTPPHLGELRDHVLRPALALSQEPACAPPTGHRQRLRHPRDHPPGTDAPPVLCTQPVRASCPCLEPGIHDHAGATTP